MLLLDIVLIVMLVIALIVGAVRGFIASLGSLIGLVVGVLAAWWLVPLVNDAWPYPEWRSLVVVGLALVLVLGGTAIDKVLSNAEIRAMITAIGAGIAGRIRSGVDRTPLRIIDRLLGAAAGVVATALALSLIGASVTATGAPMLAPAVGSSQVLQTIDRYTPTPVSQAMAQLRAIVLDDGIPRLGELLAPQAEATEPPIALDDPELATAAASVARVSGTAYACGTSSTGSGFVIAADRVVTNAHVIAGVDEPLVQLPGGQALAGRVVYFDAVDDIAVIAVDGLDAEPLALGDVLTPGSAAVVQGYPLGGPFTQNNAQVLSTGTVPVPDIYSDRSEPREIYTLEALVRPGNSGGPVLTGDGVVVGIVFARGQNDDTRGYAATNAELVEVVAAAPGLVEAVSSGSCTT